MRRSDVFLPASRESRSSSSDAIDLAERAGLVRQFGSGLYGYAPMGERVRRKLVRLIESEMRAIGAQRVSLPALQGAELWEKSGRWEDFEGEMITVRDRDDRDLCLAPSHEEGIVHLLSGAVRSYADLPLLLYQVGKKYRDDRARKGLLRTREFTMKDAYSVHLEEAGLDRTYREVRGLYEQIFEAVGLDFAIVEAETGPMGGSASEEFVAPAPEGSDRLRHCTAEGCRFGVTDEHAEFASHADRSGCPDCGGRLRETNAVEIAHTFKLGTHYSASMGLTVDAPGGRRRPVMGSYGIGVDRLLGTILLQHADASGCRFPVTDRGSLAPVRASIVPLRYEGDLREAADRLHEACGPEDVLLFDDAEQEIGERFAESDLLGVPATVILGNHYRDTGDPELETRDGETRYLQIEAVPEATTRFAAPE